MAEYIERRTAYSLAKKVCEAVDSNPRVLLPQIILDLIDDLPAADVQPVRHARNICGIVPGHCEFKCSLCGAELSTVYGGRNHFGMDGGYLKYCPNCGAKMDGEG